MQSILAISLVGMSLFSSAASACGMPPARGMSLAKAMEQVETAPVLVHAEVVEAEVDEPVLADAAVLTEVVENSAEEPAVLAPPVLSPEVQADGPAVLVPAPVVLLDS
jgi:hypothetical protein